MEKKKYRIGIDAGGTKVAYGLFDAQGELLARLEHPSDKTADGPAFADQMISSVERILGEQNIKKDQVIGVGIGMPSYIIFEKGYIYLTSALENVKEFYMRDYLQERLGLRVVLDNDGNVAALAEHRKGAGIGEKNMVYMAVSTGIGSGLILNGELFRGSYGFAGECGHMLAAPDQGILCGCGNRGCYMSYASGRYITRHARIRMLEGERSTLEMYDPEKVSGVELLQAIKEEDPLALALLEQMAQNIGVCCYNIYELLNVRTYVFGGGLTAFGDILFGKVREVFDRYNHIHEFPVDFRYAALKKDFGIIGAAELLV